MGTFRKGLIYPIYTSNGPDIINMFSFIQSRSLYSTILLVKEKVTQWGPNQNNTTVKGQRQDLTPCHYFQDGNQRLLTEYRHGRPGYPGVSHAQRALPPVATLPLDTGPARL